MSRIPTHFRQRWQPPCVSVITFTVSIVMVNSAVWTRETAIGCGKTSLPSGKRAGAISISSEHPASSDNKVWMFNEHGELLITELSPEGLNIISRAKLIEPTRDQLNRRGGVTWAHPAFAYKHVFIRNDKELVCASLKK